MVSVIITTYKREPSRVLRAINSIFRQTYHEIEIIVVDDSPEDYSLRQSVKAAILERAQRNTEIDVRYIAHKTNLGACAARNTGLSASKGEYIAFLDDDDEWLPEKLEKQLMIMKSTCAGLVYCGSFVEDETRGKIGERKTEYYRGMVFDRLLLRNFIASTSFPLIRKECIQAIGGFDTTMQAAQDYDVWLRIAERYEIDYVAEPLVIYHVHAGEQISMNPHKKISGLERLNSKSHRLLDSNPTLWRCRNMALIPYYAQIGDVSKALRLWLQCVKLKPGEVIENLKYLKTVIRRLQINEYR